jgi:hypothetical protein
MASGARDSAVNPIGPLSLLEAVRAADRPEDGAETEYAPELLNKRLGTTDTVYAQIQRYSEARRRGRDVSGAEVTALARLLGRRPDAIDVFRAAGIATAHSGYIGLSGAKRGMLRILPRFLARPLARRQAGRILGRYFGAVVQRSGQSLSIDLPDEAPLSIGAGEPARHYYDAALMELLRLLTLTQGSTS